MQNLLKGAAPIQLGVFCAYRAGKKKFLNGIRYHLHIFHKFYKANFYLLNVQILSEICINLFFHQTMNYIQKKKEKYMRFIKKSNKKKKDIKY